MARRTSYSPNTALIAGEARARKYQSGFAAEGAEAFTKGFLSTYEAGLAEKNKREAKLDAAISKLNINSWHAMEAGANKQNVKIWARNQKDEYARLSEIYDKTKDRDIRDQMDAIEHAFVNLDSNIKGFTEETKLYVTAIDEKQLATKDSYKEYADLFDNIFTGSGEFSIEDNGGISFDGNNYSDITGKWNTVNNTTPTHLLKTNLKAGEAGLNGKLFDRSGNKISIKESIDASGPEATQALATQDLTGDDKYTIDGIGEVGDLSFKGMWESGNMNKKFYEDFPRVQDGGDSEWMWDKTNSGKLSNLIAEYYTDVNEWTYGKNKTIYDIENPEISKNGIKGLDDDFNFEPSWGFEFQYPTPDGMAKSKIKGQVVNVAVAKLKSAKEDDSIDGWNAMTYKYVNGEWRNEETGDATTRNQIAKDLGLHNYGISWDDPKTVKFGGGYTQGGSKPTLNWGK